MMNRKCITTVILSLTIIIFSLCNANNMKTPAETVKLFYATLFSENTAIKHNTTQTIKPYLTKDLLNKYLLLQSSPAMGECIDYDLFIGAQDTPEKFNVASEKIAGNQAEVKLELLYTSKPIHRVVRLINNDKTWRITNIFYPELHTNMRAELARCMSNIKK